MLRDISHRLEKLEAPTSRPRTGRDRDLSTCHACGGPGHLKRSCNWTGHGSPKSQAKCQICFQTGHTAAECRMFATKKTVRNSEPKKPHSARYKCGICLRLQEWCIYMYVLVINVCTFGFVWYNQFNFFKILPKFGFRGLHLTTKPDAQLK